MTKKRLKRVLALVMAFVLTVGAVIPTAAYANATGPGADVADSNGTSQAEAEQEPVLYNETDRPDLEPAEIVAAEDIIVAAGYGFDVEKSFDGISYDNKAVKVSYYAEQGSFDGNKPGDYSTYYRAEPISGKTPYLICRTISVREPETAVEENRESGEDQDGSGEEEPAPGEGEREVTPSDAGTGKKGAESPLSEGEIETFGTGDTMMVRMASAPVLKAAAKSSDSMKVSCSGYAKYCGHSMGIKYISQSGDYHNHLVYCLNLNKNTTNGTVGASSGGSSIKPEITFCMVNGARTLNGKCHNSKYSAGSASADYFITGASIHVLNGEVKLSYYNNGSSVYKKIEALVSDAKKYDEDEYDEATGVTKSITYKISPKKTEWQDMGDGLYRSKEKFVRTKTGTITNVSYKITGQPGGLTVGELKTDASDIEDDSDLKKYDICVAQTDADKPSSNFYLYCNGEAMKKILAADSTIKLTATAKSKEKGGRKWTPTVVSQQKITFLEEFEPGTVTASVKVTSKFKEGRFELHKTNVYDGRPVPGAAYYLYEDAECTDLLCKLERTKADGRALSGKETLTQGTYYLKEVKEAPGYQRDETVYPVGLEYFTLYDSDGKVTQQGKAMEVVEYPDTVGVMVKKTDSESGNFVKGAGFAVFTDAGCTQRVSVNGDGKEEVPIFYYDEDLDVAASAKFVKKQDKYYVKEVVIPDGYRDDGKVWEVAPDYGEISDFSAENTPIRCDVAAKKEDKETGAEPQGDAKLSGATYGLYAAETIVYPDGRGMVTYAGDDNITSTQGTDFVSTGVPADKDALLATVKTGEQAEFSFGNLYFGNYYIREIEPSEGYLLDETIYPVNFREAQDTHHDISLNTKVVETVKKQAFEIIKVSTDGASTETDYVKCMRGAGDTVRSIIISANSRLATLENKQVLRMLSRDELNLAELGIGVNGDGKTKTALFCVIPDSDKSYNYIIGMLYTQIFQELYYQADFNCGGRLPVHVTFMLDEFSNVALPDDYCSLLSTMRSREISSVIIIQNLAQIKALFKDTWETIPGNCDSLVYLGGNEQSTHEYISKLLGKATIDKKSSGETRGRQGSSSRNYDVLGREIMTPDEVRKMDNKKCLIFIRGFDPILDSKYNPFKHPVFAQTADGEGTPYEHEPAAEGEIAEPGFTILNKKSLAYYEGMKEKGEPVYIDTIPYEDFMLLGQVDMEKRFTDLDGLEQQERLNEDLESGLELEYAFDTEDGADGGFAAEGAETSGNRTAGNGGQQGNDGLPEGFVIGDGGGTRKPQAADTRDKAADSISYRLFHWKFSVEQKEEVKRAMAVRVPKEVILSYFYPETLVVRMMEIRRRYE